MLTNFINQVTKTITHPHNNKQIEIHFELFEVTYMD